MKPQLSVRDLCFIILVVALGCGWWTEHRRAEAAEKLAESWRAEATQSQGHLKLYRGLYAAVEESGFHISWDLYGVPQRIVPAPRPTRQSVGKGRQTSSPTAEVVTGP